MKNILVRSAAAALLCTSLILVSCGSSLIKITYDDGAYIDKKNDITYHGASVSYEPESVGKEYAQYGETVLHEITGLDPSEWLTEQYEGIGSVYYADSITLPVFDEFKSDKIYVCASGNILMHLVTIENSDDVDAIADAFINGDATDMPLNGNAAYHLKFSSDANDGIYYNILYIEDKNSSDNYLYDRGTKKCVSIGNLLEKYMPKDVVTDNSSVTSEEQF